MAYILNWRYGENAKNELKIVGESLKSKYRFYKFEVGKKEIETPVYFLRNNNELEHYLSTDTFSLISKKLLKVIIGDEKLDYFSYPISIIDDTKYPNYLDENGNILPEVELIEDYVFISLNQYEDLIDEEKSVRLIGKIFKRLRFKNIPKPPLFHIEELMGDYYLSEAAVERVKKAGLEKYIRMDNEATFHCVQREIDFDGNKTTFRALNNVETDFVNQKAKEGIELLSKLNFRESPASIRYKGYDKGRKYEDVTNSLQEVRLMRDIFIGISARDFKYPLLGYENVVELTLPIIHRYCQILIKEYDWSYAYITIERYEGKGRKGIGLLNPRKDSFIIIKQFFYDPYTQKGLGNNLRILRNNLEIFFVLLSERKIPLPIPLKVWSKSFTGKVPTYNMIVWV